jgi:hypothetical protein
MESIAVLSALTAALSFLFTEARIMEPLRNRVLRRASWLKGVVRCGYCAGHWIALGLVAASRPKLAIVAIEPIDLLLAALLVAWLAGFQWAVFCWFLKAIGK